MSTKADYHEIVVTDADWARVKAEAKRHPWAPDDPRLRGEHSSPGQQERWLLGRLVLERWAEKHGVTLDDRTIAKETDLHGAGNLLIPERDLADNPSGRFALLLAPPKRVGKDTTWHFAGWIDAADVEEVGTFRPDLPKKPWLVQPDPLLDTPDHLAVELRGLADDKRR